MPSCRKLPERRRFLKWAGLVPAALLLPFLPEIALAAESEVRSAALVPTDEFYVLNADISAELTPRLEELVSRGVALHFVAECLVTRPRWYWLDETVVERSLTYRLSYQALTRQYRLTTGALHQNFSRLDDAMQTMLRIRNWGVIDRGGLKPGEAYFAAVRFRLDIGELPKPLQVSAIGRRDWNLATDWYHWTFVAGPREAGSREAR